MPGFETSRMRVALANTLLTNDDIVPRARGAALYPTFLTNMTLVLIEVLLHRGIPISTTDESFLRTSMNKIGTSFERGTDIAIKML